MFVTPPVHNPSLVVNDFLPVATLFSPSQAYAHSEEAHSLLSTRLGPTSLFLFEG